MDDGREGAKANSRIAYCNQKLTVKPSKEQKNTSRVDQWFPNFCITSPIIVFLSIIGPTRQLITRQFNVIQKKTIFSGPALTILKSCYWDTS